MKRRPFVKHLVAKGCVLLREGAKHSIYRNTSTDRQSSVPRHAEMGKDLGVPEP